MMTTTKMAIITAITITNTNTNNIQHFNYEHLQTRSDIASRPKTKTLSRTAASLTVLYHSLCILSPRHEFM